MGCDNGIIMMRHKIMRAAKALREKGHAAAGRTPEQQAVRSTALLLKRDVHFKEARRKRSRRRRACRRLRCDPPARAFLSTTAPPQQCGGLFLAVNQTLRCGFANCRAHGTHAFARGAMQTTKQSKKRRRASPDCWGYSSALLAIALGMALFRRIRLACFRRRFAFRRHAGVNDLIINFDRSIRFVLVPTAARSARCLELAR